MPQLETILNLLGKTPYPEKMIIDNQDTDDIIECILAKHDACESDYDKFAQLFYKGNVYDTCYELWKFCKENIPYAIEKTKYQYVSRPYTILTRGYSDCKGYALFCGGVLSALCRQGVQIDWAYRFASYSLFKKKPEHVFIYVKLFNRDIFIDPVFNIFDYRKPAFWYYDYRMNDVPAKISGMQINQGGGLDVLSDHDCYCDSGLMSIGATGQQTGQLIMKISAGVASVPIYPVTAILGAAGEVVGFFLTVFGSKYTASTEVRWLDQLFEFYVMGNGAVTSDNKINQNNIATAQQWFAVALGVPVYDRLRFNSLAGHTGWPQVDGSLDARVKDYLKYPDVQQAGITYDQAQAAALIAGSLPLNNIPGAWKNQTPAPALIESGVLAPAGVTSANSLQSLFSNRWVLIALAGLGLLLILSSDNSK